MGLEPVQVPPWHESVCVHLLSSSQSVPLVAFVGVEQLPVSGSQVPATLHTGAIHVTESHRPVQTPLPVHPKAQVSTSIQLPLSHSTLTLPWQVFAPEVGQASATGPDGAGAGPGWFDWEG